MHTLRQALARVPLPGEEARPETEKRVSWLPHEKL
jgi:hypothetical protein